MSEGLRIERLSQRAFDPDAATPEQRAWQEYALAHPSMNLYHSLVWRDVVSQVFGHTGLHLLARRGERTVGVLPAFEVHFPLLGRKVVSLPYEAGSGGPLADDLDAERALIERLVEEARARRAKHVEVRVLEPSPAFASLGFDVEPSVFHSEVDLTDGEDVWKRVGRDQRGKMRKAEREGVVVRHARDRGDFESFNEVYLSAFHAFGTPPYGRHYYPTLHERLHERGDVHLFVAEQEGRVVGGYLLFTWGTRAVNKIACVLPSALRAGVFPALYGHVLAWCIENGMTWLSYGTSAPHDQGLIDFKERWGAVTHRVHRCTLAFRGRVTPLEELYDPDTLPKRAWKRLPRGLTPGLGHLLNRWFA